MDKIEDITEGLSKAYNVTIRGMKTPGQDKTKRKILKTFADVAARWPKAMTNLVNLEFVESKDVPGGFTDEGTLAHVWKAKQDFNYNATNQFKSGDMVLRFRRADSETAYDVDLQDSVDAGWAAPNTNSVEGTMMHELSHVLTMWSDEIILDKVSSWLGEYYKDHPKIGKTPEDDDRTLIALMKKEASGYSFRYDDPSRGIFGGSRPLSFDEHEFTAEAFADAEINGDKAWGLSKFIHAKMIEAYDNFAK